MQIKTDVVSIPATKVRSLVWCGDELVDWVSGGVRYALDGTVVPSSAHHGDEFDGCVATPDGEWAIIYDRVGTRGALLHRGEVVRELRRASYHASDYEYPVCIWRYQERVLICHCPERYNQLEIEVAETAERLTAGTSRSPVDFFHSRLRVSPDGRRFLSAGWVWHPWDAVAIFDVDAALHDPTHLDRLEGGTEQTRHIGLAEESWACWQSATRIILGGSDEEEDPEEVLEFPGPRLRCKGIAVFDLLSREVIVDLQLDFPAGEMMPVGTDHVLCLNRWPRLVSLRTGEVVREWTDFPPGTRASSIMRRPHLSPPMAVDAVGGRIAVVAGDSIKVLRLEV